MLDGRRLTVPDGVAVHPGLFASTGDAIQHGWIDRYRERAHALRAALMFGPVPVPPAFPSTSTVAVKVGA
jgi:hypothetical protein